MKYFSTKTYEHSEGLSAVFRQPKATHSHCHLLHGYSLKFKFVFGCDTLDEKNWVVDFGGLKLLKQWLHDCFDHTVIVDIADPELHTIRALEAKGIANVVTFDGVGCEKFAEHAFNFANNLIKDKTDGRCYVVSVECAEHGANSSIYSNE
jgi:6-pyruvoyltetrahydropterin/6-carboxytetrahydropterin synthase